MAQSSETVLSISSNPLRIAFEHWKRFAHALGVVQTRFLLVIFYFLTVLPLGLVMRVFEDRLHLKNPDGSCWVPHRHEDQSLETARRQF